MRSASPQTVDRLIGVFVAVCASAMLVAIGARAGPSFTTLFRLSYFSHGGDSRSGSRRRSRSRARGSPWGHDDKDVTIGALVGDGGAGSDEEGDAYYAYAYGSRSGAVRAAARRVPGRGQGRFKLVVHTGSCHCGGLAFEVKAPEHLIAIEGPSKVRYPFITVPSEHFRLTSDDSNGSLYLLKCRPASGRDSTTKVSAHFFCRRCGVHVVHAPDFPHAAVADVNVHCIGPESVKSLGVGFVNGGGAELPGVGDAVEGMYEVGKESWSDAMRERLSIALQQPLGDAARGGSRLLSPRRRPPSSAPAPLGGSTAFGVERGDGDGIRKRRNVRGGIVALGAGGTMRAPDAGAYREAIAEDPRRAASHIKGLSSGRGSPWPSAGSGSADARNGGARGSSSSSRSWGEVLMHVASLPSSTSSASASATQGRKTALGGRRPPRTSELLLRAEREQRLAFGSDTSLKSRQRGRGKTDAEVARANDKAPEASGEHLSVQRRRSLSVDSGPGAARGVNSSPADIILAEDGSHEAIAERRVSAGGTREARMDAEASRGARVGSTVRGARPATAAGDPAVDAGSRNMREFRATFGALPEESGMSGFAAAQA